MRSKKMLGIVVLSAMVLSTTIPNTTAFAAAPSATIFATTTNVADFNNKVVNNKINFKFIKNTSGNIEYTYDKDGKSYKVIENFKEDFSYGTSSIYEKNSDGSYTLSSKTETTSKKGSVTVKTTDLKTNKTTVDVINASDPVKVNNSVNVSDSLKSNNSQISATASSSDLTDWNYNGNFGYNVKVANYTAGAIAAVFFSNLSKLAGSSAKASSTITLLSYLAGVAISESLPKVYQSVDLYYKYVKGTYLPRAESSYTSVWTDSSRKTMIGNDSVYYEYYVPGWN